MVYAVSADIALSEWSSAHESSEYSQDVTECDRLAAHPDDPGRVSPGLGQASMDLRLAIGACRADLADDPDNPRLLYQLARALTYAGEIEEGLPLLARASALEYPQALFVEGYLYLTGLYGAEQDVCRAGDLILRSARLGRLAGQVGFPAYVLEDRFVGCAVEQNPTELLEMLKAAQRTRLDFYADLLVGLLIRELSRDASSAADVSALEAQ